MPPEKGVPKYPYSTMRELRQHADKNNLSITQVMMANEMPCLAGVRNRSTHFWTSV